MKAEMAEKGGGAEGDRTPDLYTASEEIAPKRADSRANSGAESVNAERTSANFGPSRSQDSSAVISPCGTYRYRLERSWGVPAAASYGQTTIIMVNPSTADATTNDATIRKLIGFGAQRWANIVVGNLFAYRATDVRELASAADPIGPENDEHLRAMIGEADRLIFAWGPASKLPKRLRTRWRAVWDMAQSLGKEPLSIGKPANDGHPKHPLMLAYDTPLQPWRPAL